MKLALQSAGGYPAAANFPRAHFPFPERGRCALGVEVPLHPSVSTTARSAGGGSWPLKDCWSLGEEVPPPLQTPGVNPCANPYVSPVARFHCLELWPAGSHGSSEQQ